MLAYKRNGKHVTDRFVPKSLALESRQFLFTLHWSYPGKFEHASNFKSDKYQAYIEEISYCNRD